MLDFARYDRERLRRGVTDAEVAAAAGLAPITISRARHGRTRLREKTFKRIAERLDREAKGWKPEPGDKLVGRVIGRVDGIEGGFEPYSIVTIETDAGEIIDLHCFHTTLRSEVARRNPQPGDEIGVKYYGRVTEGGRTGTGFEKYQVYVEKARSVQLPPAVSSSRLERLARDAGLAPVPSESDRPEDDEY